MNHQAYNPDDFKLQNKKNSAPLALQTSFYEFTGNVTVKIVLLEA